jgi:hypothetical protein
MALLMSSIGGMRNHQDSARKSKSVQAGLERRARQRGKLNGAPRPYGYRWVKWLDDQSKPQSRLEQVPAEVPVVERIYADFIGGQSALAIARALTEAGITAAKGGPWRAVSVRQVLLNPVYMGKVRFNDEVYDGIHEPIISEDTWQEAAAWRTVKLRRPNGAGPGKRRAAPGTNNGGGRSPVNGHLLTKGLLRCGVCGGAMSPRRDNRYHCLGRTAGGAQACTQGSVLRTAVDDAMARALADRYLNIEDAREQVRAIQAGNATIANEAVEQADTELLRVQERLQRIKRAMQDGHLEAADYAEQRAELTEDLAGAEAAAERARTQAAQAATRELELPAEVFTRLAELKASVVDGLEIAPNTDALRTLLRQLFEKVLYLQPGHPLLESVAVRASAEDAGAEGYLLPVLRAGVILGYDGETSDGAYHWDDIGETLGPFDAAAVTPTPIISRRSLPIHLTSTVRNSSNLMGFEMKSSMPASRQRSRSPSIACAVIAITGTCSPGASRRRSSAVAS